MYQQNARCPKSMDDEWWGDATGNVPEIHGKESAPTHVLWHWAPLRPLIQWLGRRSSGGRTPDLTGDGRPIRGKAQGAWKAERSGGMGGPRTAGPHDSGVEEPLPSSRMSK